MCLGVRLLCIFLCLYKRNSEKGITLFDNLDSPLVCLFALCVCLSLYLFTTYGAAASVHHVVPEPSDVWVGGAGWMAGVHPSTGQSWWPASVVREDIYKETLAIVAL